MKVFTNWSTVNCVVTCFLLSGFVCCSEAQGIHYSNYTTYKQIFLIHNYIRSYVVFYTESFIPYVCGTCHTRVVVPYAFFVVLRLYMSPSTELCVISYSIYVGSYLWASRFRNSRRLSVHAFLSLTNYPNQLMLHHNYIATLAEKRILFCPIASSGTAPCIIAPLQLEWFQVNWTGPGFIFHHF